MCWIENLNRFNKHVIKKLFMNKVNYFDEINNISKHLTCKKCIWRLLLWISDCLVAYNKTTHCCRVCVYIMCWFVRGTLQIAVNMAVILQLCTYLHICILYMFDFYTSRVLFIISSISFSFDVIKLFLSHFNSNLCRIILEIMNEIH